MKVILKVIYFNVDYETRRALRDKVVEQLNTDGVAIVPQWCDVIVVDDNAEVKQIDKDSSRKA